MVDAQNKAALRRDAKHAAFFGVLAGIVFAAMQVVAAVGLGMLALMPFRMFASIVLGSAALDEVSVSTAVVVGSVVHLVLSAVFGALYGLFNARQAGETRRRWGSQAMLGILFGLLLWLVNLQVLARLFFPWFAIMPQFNQLLLHALFYGLPLGLMFAAAQRRIRQLRRVSI